MIYDKKSLVSPISLHTYKAMVDLAEVSHPERVQRVESLQREIQEQLDLIAQLKKVEDKLVRRVGLNGNAVLTPSGELARNVNGTLEGFGENDRSTSPAKLKSVSFVDETRVKNNDYHNKSQQDVGVGMRQILEKVYHEDSAIRRIAHKILKAKLLVEIKRATLEKLVQEQQEVETSLAKGASDRAIG